MSSDLPDSGGSALDFLQQTLDVSFHAGGIIGSGGRLVHVNEQFLRMWGYHASDAVVGRPMSEFCGNDVLWEALISQGRTERVSGTAKGFRNDGSSFEVEYLGRMIEDRMGRPRYLMAHFRPATGKEVQGLDQRNSAALQDAILRTQVDFLSGTSLRELFPRLLKTLLRTTGSEYGYICEVVHASEGNPAPRLLAVVSDSQDSRYAEFFRLHASDDLSLLEPGTLSAIVVETGDPVISNDPSSDPRGRGVPEGHPPLRAFLGLPLKFGGRLVGTVGVANRPGGYHSDLVHSLEPFLTTAAAMVEARRKDHERRSTEAAVERAKKQWEQTFDAIPDLIALIDRDHRIIRVNRAMAFRLGMSPTEAVGRHCYELVHGTDTPVEDCPYRQTIREGKERAAEVEIEKLHGTFHVSTSPVFDDQGNVRYCVHVAREVTEIKELTLDLFATAKNLKQMSVRLRAMVKAATAIAESSDFADVSRRVFEICRDLVGARAGYVALLSSDGKRNDVLFADPGPERRTSGRSLSMPVGQLTGEAYRTGRVVYENDFGSCKWDEPLPRDHVSLESVLFAPIIVEGKPVGLLGLINKPGGFIASDGETAQAFADLVSVAFTRSRALDDLASSEERYRSIFFESLDGVFEISNEGRVLDANTAFLNLFGYTWEEMRRLPVENLLDDPEQMKVFKAEVERKGFLRDYEIRLKRKDGAIRICLVSANGHRSPEGEVITYTGVVRDMTEFLETEERLRDQRNFLNSLLEAVAHPFYVIDPEDYSIVMANTAAKSAFGSHARTCYEMSHGRNEPCNSSKQPCPLEMVKRTRKPATVEHVHYDQSGSARIVEVFAYPVLDEKDQVRYVIEYSVDVTERAMAEKDRVRLMAAIEQAAEVVLITDPEGRIEYVNPSFQEKTGYSPEEVMGRKPSILKSGKHDQVFYEELWNTIKRGETWHGHLINKKKDGSLFHEDCVISPVRDPSGAIVNFVAVKRDVTKEVELERQLRQAGRMEAIATLAGGVAHDFNNLLTIILGYSELLLAGDEQGESLSEALNAIHLTAERGADLVKRILTFSRRVETTKRPVHLNQEIRQTEQLLRRTIPKMIEIELVLSEDVRPVKADAAQLNDILINLAVNARDAMPNGGRLTIETRDVTLDHHYCARHLDVKPGRYALLLVSDTGHGIEKARIDRIFEPFYTTKAPGEGSGLGLSMVHGIVKDHGGHILCYSEPGVGTTFKIYLPVLSLMEAESVPEKEEPLPRGTEVLLLADDEELIRSLAVRILSQAGYTVLPAGSGEEALKIYEKQRDRISLVLLDLIMPGMGGAQCLERLLELDPRVKVVIASGYSPSGPARTVIDVGAKAFVEKPFEARKLLATIREVLDAE